MLKQAVVTVGALWLSVTAIPAVAQPATQPPPSAGQAPAKPVSPNVLIMEQLRSGDDGKVGLAVQTIEQLLAGMPKRRVSHDWAMQWVEPLTEYKRYDLIARLSTAMVCARPDDVRIIEFFQRAKVTALMAEEKHEEALSASKALYNASTLRSTARSIDMVAECFVNARGSQEPEIGRLFRAQQAAGAKVLDNNTANLLRSVQVDASVYEEALKRLDVPACKTLLMRGNVLLLADRAADARACFEKARQMANNADWVVATEGIARAIRAQDGLIAGANTFLASERQSAGQ